MYIKKLEIISNNKLLRDMKFHSGLNLIIDETPITDEHLTGNNVGKTTVLKLIDFCLGGKPEIIYTDTEDKKKNYDLVKEYLSDKKILIKLVLVESLYDENSREIVIERNFLKGKNTIRKINEKDILKKDFEEELRRLILPNHKAQKPSFRQIISHNIRYKDENINNTLKTLNRYTSDVEYESLYLFLLGCTFVDGAKKQSLISKIKQEETYRNRLEKKQTKTAYETALSIIDDEIEELNNKKSMLNLNENFEQDLENLNLTKYKINKSSSVISKLKIRENIIQEAQREMEKSISKIDLKQLDLIYKEATINISGIQKTFEDLVKYHNNMLAEKSKFITAELPSLIEKIQSEKNIITELLKQEKELAEEIAKSDSFEELEKIIADLNERYRLKGEYENIIEQLREVEKNISDLNEKIHKIDKSLFSVEFEESLKKQIQIFNKYFSSISYNLYGEKYALNYDKIIDKKNRQVYKFSAFNINMSSGKKQGEILCFDLAYILFADKENIPCLHFLLNDKKELMHDNQLKNVADFVEKNDIQLVISILKDKLPEHLLEKGNVVVELSQESKLFKIE